MIYDSKVDLHDSDYVCGNWRFVATNGFQTQACLYSLLQDHHGIGGLEANPLAIHDCILCSTLEFYCSML